MSSELSCLPNLTLVALAVADEYEYVAVAAVELVAESCAGSGRHALAQRAGGQVNARGLGTVGMGREVGVRLVEGISLLDRIEALQAEGSVHSRTCVALGQYAPVTILPVRVLRIYLHNLTVQNCQRVDNGHCTRYMAEAKRTDGLQGLHTDFLSKYAKLLHLFCFLHCIHLPNS